MDSKHSAPRAPQGSTFKRSARGLVRITLAAFALALAAGSAAGPLPAAAVLPAAVSSSGTALSPSAQAQIARLQQIKATRTAAERKLDSQLLLAELAARGDARVAGLDRFHFLTAEADGRWPVDVLVADGGDARRVLELLRGASATVQTPKREIYRSGLVRARLASLDVLSELAASPDVKLVRQALPTLRSAASAAPLADVQGLRAHGIEQVRSTLGARGAGSKVCVISDGIDALPALQAQRAMPAVDLLPGRRGHGNEGLAMLSVIHEVAPAAALGFAGAGEGQADYISALQGLAARGCSIVVDDLLSLDESPFEDSAAAQAVDDVSAKGVLVISAAGNHGNVANASAATWEGDFRAGSSGLLHDFGDGGESIRVVEAGSDATAVLIWAEHYTLTRGEAATDYDLYELDASGEQVLNASLNLQDGRGGDDFPVESLRHVGKGSRLAVARNGALLPGSASPMFNLLLPGGQLDPALATAGAVRGHGAAASALSIGAVSAQSASSTMTTFSRGSRVERSSADGPRRVLLDRSGEALTPGNRGASGGIVRQKPDMVAADQVSTLVPGYASFAGTSAAAAHAAGIAALLRGATPTATTGALRTALTRSALDIESAGVDATSGAGVIMPMAALQATAAASQSVLVARVPALIEFAGDGDSAIEPNEIWSLQLPLSNTGSATAARITATFTANTPNVTVLSGSSAYPDIAAGASAANSTNFQFRVEPGYPCGQPLSFTVVVTSDSAGSPQTFPVTQPTGGEGTPVVVSYGGPVVPIPDGTLSGPGPLATASVALAGVSAIRDVNLSLDGSLCTTSVGATTVGIDHSYVADLELSLRAPNGVVVPLITAVGGSGNNFCQTLLDDQSSGGSIQDVDFTMAPFTGTFTPASALSAFNGGNGNGNWTLQMQDDAAADTGNLRSFTLSVTPAVCDAPPLPRGPFVQSILRAAASPTRANSLGYTVQFSEPVTGVDASDFVLTTTGALSGAAITGVSGSGSSYTVNVASGSGSGTLRLDLVDNDSIRNASGLPLGGTGAGNGNYVSGEVYAVDRTGPTVSLAASSGQGDPATVSPVRFDVQFDEATTQFAADDVILGGSAGATTATVSGSGSSYVVSVSGMTANGTLSVGIRAGAISDAAGNPSTASNTVSLGYGGLVPDVGFTLGAQSLTEGSGAGSTVATVTATLSRASTQTVTLPVLVDPASTATGGGNDYSLSASQLVFPAGTTSASLSVTITRDLVQEPDETIVLRLGTPSNATVGAPATQTITIVNDDDTTPDAFAFTPVGGVALLSAQTSNAITVTGINQPAAITVSGGSYRVNGGAATSSAGTVVAGDSVTVSLNASALFATPATATLSIGGVSGSFTATTRAALTLPDPFAFLAVTDAALSALVVSNPITVTGIEIGVPITVSGGEYNLNGGAFTSAPGTANPNDVVRVRQTASALAATTTTAVLSIGSGSAARVSSFAVTTAGSGTTGGGTTGGGTTGGGTTGGGSTGGSTTGTSTGGVLPEGGGAVPVGGSGGGSGGGASGPGLLLTLMLALVARRRRETARG